MGSEKAFETKIKKYIEDQGGWQVKFFANRMTKNGIPDILACVNGYFLAVEVKAENGKPSELQKHHVTKINNSKGIGIILYPWQYELFKDIVQYLIEDNREDAAWVADLINERSLQNGNT